MPIIQTHKEIASFVKGDVCIIGSGPAAAFAAVELAKKKFDVIVIETGGSNPNLNNNIDEIKSSSIYPMSKNRGFTKEFGGLSNWWAGRTTPLEKFDFVNDNGLNNPRWPISLNDLLPFYKKASQIMGIPFEKIWGNKKDPKIKSIFWNQNELSNFFSPKEFFWNTPPFKTREYLESHSNKYKNLKIYIGVHARYFIQNKPNQIESLEAIVHATKKKLVIKCNNFILAAGGLENPRILLNSKRKNMQYKNNYCKTIGKGFLTHPKANIGILTLKHKVSTNDPFFSDQKYNYGKYRLCIGLNNLYQKKSNLNHCIQFSPIMEYKFNNFFEKANDSIFLNNSFLDRTKHIKPLIPSIGLKLYEKFNRFSRIKSSSKTFMLRGFFDQTSNQKNKIYLSRKKDSLGDFKISINWNISKKDKKNIQKFISILKNVFRYNKIGLIESKNNAISTWKFNGIHSHFIGTTKMGSNPYNSVVDKNCRVHQIKNLYISGPSVFSNGGFANPFLTIAAISLRLGNHLSKKTLKQK